MRRLIEKGGDIMEINEALNLAGMYGSKGSLTPEEEFAYIEALEYLISVTKDPGFMVDLGSYYYEQKRFDEARQYYEMADELGDKWAAEGLGYIWYYGRTGEKDYEKAFKYYSKAAGNGQLRSKMKVADMYRNGYYVEKDYEKYCSMIEELYLDTHQIGPRESPMAADVAIRLAKIRKERGEIGEAIRLLMEAREQVAYRLTLNPFFGDISVMKGIEEDLAGVAMISKTEFDLYDLFRLMKVPRKVSFQGGGGMHLVESDYDVDGELRITFDGSKFDSIDDFFMKAEINGVRLPQLYYGLGAFRIEE